MNNNGCIKFILVILLIAWAVWCLPPYFKAYFGAIDYAPDCIWAEDPITCAEVVKNQNNTLKIQERVNGASK